MDPKRVLKYKKEITTMAKRTVENHAIFAAYMTGDLTDPLLTARLNLCRKFARVGMYVFKTGPPFEYTRLPIDDEHVRLLEEADRASDNEFAEPRYRVSNDERSLVDLLEYMQRCLVFPSNATYNVSDTVSFRNKNVSWTEVTNRNFANEKRKKRGTCGEYQTTAIGGYICKRQSCSAPHAEGGNATNANSSVLLAIACSRFNTKLHNHQINRNWTSS